MGAIHQGRTAPGHLSLLCSGWFKGHEGQSLHLLPDCAMWQACDCAMWQACDCAMWQAYDCAMCLFWQRSVQLWMACVALMLWVATYGASCIDAKERRLLLSFLWCHCQQLSGERGLHIDQPTRLNRCARVSQLPTQQHQSWCMAM